MADILGEPPRASSTAGGSGQEFSPRELCSTLIGRKRSSRNRRDSGMVSRNPG